MFNEQRRMAIVAAVAMGILMFGATVWAESIDGFRVADKVTRAQVLLESQRITGERLDLFQADGFSSGSERLVRLTPAAAAVRTMFETLDDPGPLALHLEGQVTNPSARALRVNFTISAPRSSELALDFDNPTQSVVFGSVIAPAESSVDLSKHAKINARLIDFLVANPKLDSVSLRATVRPTGTPDTSVEVDWLALTSSPMHHTLCKFDDNDQETISPNLELTKAHLDGEITNRSKDDLRVIIAISDERPDEFSDGPSLIADGVVGSGQTVTLSRLLTSNGRELLIDRMDEASSSSRGRAHLILLSAEEFKAKVSDMQIATEAQFR
jgi:hypothetical protein